MKGLLAQICIRILGIIQDEDDEIDLIQQIQDMVSILSDEGTEMKLPGLEKEDFQYFADFTKR